VTNRSNIRTWSNSRGEGKLFSMEIVDESVSAVTLLVPVVVLIIPVLPV
jgi:ssDNA-binding replication factor A large subunit